VAVKKQTLPMHPEWPRKLTRLLSACLSHDPSLRPSFLELMQLLAVVRRELQELGLLHTVPQRFDDVEVRLLLSYTDRLLLSATHHSVVHKPGLCLRACLALTGLAVTLPLGVMGGAAPCSARHLARLYCSSQQKAGRNSAGSECCDDTRSWH
jgi:hypothetical protein